MRKIKFRAWDETEKKMYYATDISNPQNGIWYEDDEEGNLQINKIIDSFGCRRELIKQQFTGLLDKNGEEIYEGDIVSVIDDNNIFEVKFGKVERNILGFDTNTIYPIEINTFYFEQEGKAYFSITDNFLGKNDIEDTIVIGNIFENPELKQI